MASPISSSFFFSLKMNVWIVDIFEVIARDLSQFDLVNLCLTCKVFYSICLPLLYQSITLDSRFSQFDDEYQIKNYHNKTTFIKTKSNFITFINRCIDERQKFGPLTKDIKIVNIPPEFYDFELFLMNDKKLFNNLNLNKFESSIPTGFKLLEQMISNSDIRSNLSELKYMINIFGNITSLDLIDAHNYKFHNLKTVSFSNIANKDQARKLLNLISLQSIENLENLSLHLQNKSITLIDLINGDYNRRSKCKLNDGTELLLSLENYINLKKLSISSIFIQINELKNLSFFTKNLTFLELEDVITIYDSTSDSNLLKKLFPNDNEINLTNLKLDIRSIGFDCSPNFVSNKIPRNQLKELDLTIRYNNTLSLSLNELIDLYISSILNHSKSLEKLSIEIKNERRVLNSTIEHLSFDHLSALICDNYWPTLKSLRLQTCFHLINEIKLNLFENMPLLDKIWIMGPNAVPKHFGLGTMNDGIYDKWWRLIHLPKWFVDGIDNHPLKYIKIDDCLFKVDHNEREVIQPKDSIDDIFYNMTKVIF